MGMLLPKLSSIHPAHTMQVHCKASMRVWIAPVRGLSFVVGSSVWHLDVLHMCDKYFSKDLELDMPDAAAD